MSGRKKLIIGNWKMHFTVKQAVSFANKLAAKKIPDGVEVVLSPPALALSEVSAAVKQSDLKVAGQNAYFQDEGAFTGEVSMPMLRGIAQYVLVGHSERRHVFHESQDLIRHKVAAAVRSGLTPVLCVGETLVERQYFHTKQVVSDQLLTGIADLTAEEVAKIVVAYEPVWAIKESASSKRKAATPEDALHAAQVIRKDIAELYGQDAAKKLTILYGGSVDADNAAAFLRTGEIDGLLPGSTSLSMQTFWPIVEKASQLTTKKITIKKAKA
jgi:triosephosphate isomerase